MIIKAKFKGERDVLGYTVGSVYTLEFDIENGIFASYKNHIIIRCISKNLYNSGYCPYSSLKSFLNNWEVL